jgi:hypothetical protein
LGFYLLFVAMLLFVPLYARFVVFKLSFSSKLRIL